MRLEAVPRGLREMPGGRVPLPFSVPALGGWFLLVSGTGSRARDTALHPAAETGLFEVLPGGGEMRWLAGRGRPTSELPAHLLVHEALLAARPGHRAVLHAHPAWFIALTHLPEFPPGSAMSEALLPLQGETRRILPGGVAHLPYAAAGSRALGEASAEAIRRCYVVVWQAHGALSTGADLAQALDYLQYAEKAAEIYWLLRLAGVTPGT